MNKNFLIAIIIIIVIAAGIGIWFLTQGKRVASPLPSGMSEDDTVAAINEDLEKIDAGNIDRYFEDIDADWNRL